MFATSGSTYRSHAEVPQFPASLSSEQRAHVTRHMPVVSLMILQILLNMLSFNLDPQSALDASRVCITDGTPGGSIVLESGIPEHVISELAKMGHHVVVQPVTGFGRSIFGRGQIIVQDRQSGVLWGASDGRGDGCAMGW